MELIWWLVKGVVVVVLAVIVFGHRYWKRYWRVKHYFRGRSLKELKSSRLRDSLENSLRFGNDSLPQKVATQHFLVAGTTGSGKTHVQRLLLEQPLKNIEPESDARFLIFDAKGETTAYLNRIGVNVPIYSLNPFESRTENPIAVAWDIGRDVTTPLRANNLSHSMITGDASGTNGYFVKAARAVVAGCIKSFIRHAGTEWCFSDLIYATTNWDRMKEVLKRDEEGEEILEMFLGNNTTGYGVASTVVADMKLYSPVASLWQRCDKRLSIREWLKDSSILLLGENETASATLDVLNQQMFAVFVEEVLTQSNSSTRRTGLWIDEAQQAKCLLRSGRLQSFAAKARSRGGCMVIAFQDIEGFRVAAGDQKIADSIIAQCSHKALLRQESYESARWASELLGQFETIEVFHSDSRTWRSGDPGSEQRVVKDAVLPSEFFSIPETSWENGLTGYFVSSGLGARRMTVPGNDIAGIAVTDEEEVIHAIVSRPDSEQWLRQWTFQDKVRLGLVKQYEPGTPRNAAQVNRQPRKLRFARQSLETLRMPEAAE